MSSPSSIAPRARRLSALLFACLLPSVHAAAPATVTGGEVSISRAWARATPPGATMGAVYLTIENRGRQADTLLDANCPVASAATFHYTSQREGVSHMAPAGAIAIGAGQVLKVRPIGLHLMLTGLKQPLVAGRPIALTLRFQRAGDVPITAQVIPLSAPAPDDAQQPLQHQVHAGH
jgi:copper(I)-binding protein